MEEWGAQVPGNGMNINNTPMVTAAFHDGAEELKDSLH